MEISIKKKFYKSIYLLINIRITYIFIDNKIGEVEYFSNPLPEFFLLLILIIVHKSFCIGAKMVMIKITCVFRKSPS